MNTKLGALMGRDMWSKLPLILILGLIALLGCVSRISTLHEYPTPRASCARCHISNEPSAMDLNPKITADSTNFCLSCHNKEQDKSNSNPPYVKNSPIILAGGDFAFAVKSPGNGHSVEEGDPVNALKPPGGEKSLYEFTCLSCHSPHNNGNYRNLRTEINKEPTIVKAKGDKKFIKNRYISGMNNFCSSCHVTFLTTPTKAPYGMHPVGVEIKEKNSSDNPSVRVEEPEGKRTVFCLSCHHAHAGPYFKALVWDGLKEYTMCLECHPR